MTAPDLVGPPTPKPAGPWLVGALVGLVVLLLGTCTVLTVLYRSHLTHRDQLQQARVDSVAAARQLIVNLNSVGAATIDADITRILGEAGGTFKDQFTRDSAQLKSLVVNGHAVLGGTIRSAGVVRVDRYSATVLVAADQTVTLNGQTRRPTAFRSKLELEKHHGRWLVVSVESVS